MTMIVTPLLTQREAASHLRLSERTLERFRLTGGGPRFAKAGRRIVYRAEDLEAWIAEASSLDFRGSAMTYPEPHTTDMREQCDNIAATEMLPPEARPAASTALVPATPDKLATLTAGVLEGHNEYERSLWTAHNRAIEIGLALIELKKELRAKFGHGHFEAYVTEKFPFTMRTAQNYMRQGKRKVLDYNENESDFRFLKTAAATKTVAGVSASGDEAKAK